MYFGRDIGNICVIISGIALMIVDNGNSIHLSDHYNEKEIAMVGDLNPVNSKLQYKETISCVEGQ